jgi:Rrf2 family protein
MLTITTQHALRALVELARLEPGQTMLGKDLAREASIPANYLSKILWTLGSTGMIEATRGTHGGYRLGRSPQAIRLIEIVELFDKARTANACLLDGGHPCGDATPCAAHSSWREVKAAYTDFLNNTTLATLVARAEAVPEGFR